LFNGDSLANICLCFTLVQFYTVDVFVGHLETNEMRRSTSTTEEKKKVVGITHPICINASPVIVAEDELNKPGGGRMFVGKQSVRDVKIHHGV
jgi:hypothetical protein